MRLARRAQAERRRRCRCTSSTTSNTAIAVQPHVPFGFRKGICFVGAIRRCALASPASRRLAIAPAAPGTQPHVILGQASSTATSGDVQMPVDIGRERNSNFWVQNPRKRRWTRRVLVLFHDSAAAQPNVVVLGFHWKQERHLGAATLLALHRDFAAVIFHDLEDNAET
jgi:hypothetical protein